LTNTGDRRRLRIMVGSSHRTAAIVLLGRRLLSRTWWATLIGLIAAIVGIAVLVVYALSEVLADPTLTLEDGYWIGRLPWTTVGVALTVIGATVALVAGVLTAWIAGGAVRRVVTALAVAVGAFWWLFATLPLVGLSGACCGPRPDPDPLTMAYSVPQAVILFLLLPAALTAIVALTVTHRDGPRRGQAEAA
jgi:hypothetical protein